MIGHSILALGVCLLRYINADSFIHSETSRTSKTSRFKGTDSNQPALNNFIPPPHPRHRNIQNFTIPVSLSWYINADGKKKKKNHVRLLNFFTTNNLMQTPFKTLLLLLLLLSLTVLFQLNNIQVIFVV